MRIGVGGRRGDAPERPDRGCGIARIARRACTSPIDAGASNGAAVANEVTVALSRTILESAWWIMSHDADYHDLGPEHFFTRAPDPARRAQRLLLELRVLGQDIRLPDPPGDQPNG